MKFSTPALIGNVKLKNRFIFPSMCNYYCDSEGFVTEQLKAYVRARAEGGAAAIIMPGSPHGKPGPARPALSDPRYYDGWRALQAICQKEDCRLFVQIHPVNIQAGRDPSALLPDHMPVYMIRQIIDSYAACARAAREIGLSGVEIHGAHAHEVAQFLSPYYNHRTDAYGGSVVKRCRLAVELVQAIKRTAGEDFPVIFRLSSDECVPGGRDIEETLEMVPLLEQAGVDALHVSIGMPLSECYISAPMDVEDGFNLAHIARIRKAVHIPVIAVNRINTPELAERVIAEDIADFVAVGRGMLADPQFAKKAISDDPIRLCLGCNQGCKKSVTKKAIYCLQNPFTGREASLHLTPSDALACKRMLVIGAGVAGLEAAMDLALRGAHPEIWEQQSHAGGLIQLASIPPKKAVMRRLIDYRLAELARLGVTVRLNQKATPEAVAAYRPDLIILATGSVPAVPPIDGLQSKDILTADEALLRMKQGGWQQGQTCAVLGGGMTGLEVADALCERACTPEVFEMAGQAGEGLAKERRVFLRKRLEAGGCRIHVSTRVTRIAGGRITCETEGERNVFGPYDVIINALGRKSDASLLNELRACCPDADITVLGDASKPGTVLDATASAAIYAAGVEG